MRNYSNTKILNEEVRQLRSAWKLWDLYTRKGGPADYQLNRVNERRNEIIARMDGMNMREGTRDKWHRKIAEACMPAPPAPKVEVAHTPCAGLPLWRGPLDEGHMRRVVGVVWMPKLGHWAIQIKTRLGWYRNTHTEGMTMCALAYAVDFARAVLERAGYFSARPGRRRGEWNDYDMALEKLDERQPLRLDWDIPMHKHLDNWMARIQKKQEYLGHYPHCTLRDIPKNIL